MRLLVVEDEEPLAAALRDGLGSEGFVVDVAGDGAEGFQLACAGHYDAIVLDLMLPRLNGYRVCSHLRATGIWTPILVLTAKQGELDEAEVLDTGADDFLSKPFSFTVLVARLRALLRRRGNGSVGRLIAGDLELDNASRHCRRGDHQIDLTPREFALLAHLMHRAGEAVPRRELLDEVWDFAFDDDSNIVEVYVGYLRKKVDAPFGRHAIETVRGVGYRLDPDGG